MSEVYVHQNEQVNNKESSLLTEHVVFHISRNGRPIELQILILVFFDECIPVRSM